MSGLDSASFGTSVGSGAERPAPQVFGVHLKAGGVAMDAALAEVAAQADRILQRLWAPNELKQRLGDLTAELKAAARIFCTGPVRVPEVGDLRFEPVIITPTRFVWRKLLFVPFALLIMAFWLAQVTHMLKLPFTLPLGAFGYVLSMGGIALVMWIWRTTVRPSYVRLAPGMVQVLEYRLRGGKPVIRSYPMLPGTLVVVRQGKKERRPSVVQLVRGDQADVLPVSQMKDSDEAMEHIWQALRSTAPTPPLNEEELVG